MEPRIVRFRLPDGREAQVTAEPGEHVLEAGLREGLELPYRCLQGWCLTCAARLVEGEVDQRDARRYFDEDREAGFCLPCTAFPSSNLILETHARDAMRANRTRHGLPFPRGDWGA